MPEERLRIATGLSWAWSVIRPCRSGGMETELFFERDGAPFSLTMDVIPEPKWFSDLYDARSLVVYEISQRERGWLESGRYRVAIDEDYEGVAVATVTCDHVRWAPE